MQFLLVRSFPWLEEKGISYKEVKQEIFKMICEVGRELTQEILERYNGKLHEKRNKSEFRDKGCRRFTIKTAYGEVSFDRHVYQVRDDYGINKTESNNWTIY